MIIMDWASVVSVAITGAVGIAGVIAGARISGKSARENLQFSISAENERARIAEKRRIYAKFMATCLALADTSRVLRDPRSYDHLGHEGVGSIVQKSINATYDAISELILIAPKDIRALAQELLSQELQRLSNDSNSDQSNTGKNMTAKLSAAMRADLGEPAGPIGE